jgi:hypothetical protein
MKLKSKKSLSKQKTILTIIMAILVISSGLVTADIKETPKPTIAITEADFDDCDTQEVLVSGIISPPINGRTGTYDVTAEFTSVGIIINGEHDVDENEPWIEHYSSPDDYGIPEVNIYTSCDEHFIYIAFETFPQNDEIIAFEIFLDMNINNEWDGNNIDTYLHGSYPHSYVLDKNDDDIADSQVSWSNFTEIKIPKLVWNDCNNWAYRVRSIPCDQQDPCLVDVPSEIITADIDYAVDTFFDITLSDIYGDYDVQNGTYPGWCIEYGPIANTIPHASYIYSSLCPPSFVNDAVNWSRINYILNYKPQGANNSVIQEAIWYFINLGEQQIPNFPETWILINEAINNTGFKPESGEIIAVILDPVIRVPGYQRTIIEVIVPEAGECSWNPNWGDNSHPSETPPAQEFLIIDCSYGFNCSCGVAFKALADIYEIHPGDCTTLYETDFENETLVEEEWIAKSLDTFNNDTWNLSTARSQSSSNSYHSTENDEYFGNAFDVLEMKQGLNLANVINVSFNFWHWCEGDTFEKDGDMLIADYGYVEFYTDISRGWEWIPLKDLSLSEIFYDNGWIKTTIEIDSTKTYKLNGENISGDDLLKDGNKFRFVWISDSQFQYEGWYIDDVEVIVCQDEWYDINDPLYQSQSIGPDHWCIPFGSTIEKTFPLAWTPPHEGKYLVRVCVQEEPPWCGLDCFEQIITIGDIHDVAVIDIDPPLIISPGDDLFITGTVKNVGTFDETNVEVQATLKKDGQGSPIWEQTKIIPLLNISEVMVVNFTWEDATYCDYLLEIKALVSNDEVPWNNSMTKWILVADTLFFDHVDDDCNWTHIDLTGGEGHWNICTSGYDDYLWCGLQSTTKYDDNWNDIAMINHSFDLTGFNTFTFSFETQFEIDLSDSGIVEYSIDGGRHWQALSSVITGYSDWITISVLKDITGETITDLMIRFRFYSDEEITDRGWIIDDILLTANNGTEVTLFSDDLESGLDAFLIERLRAGDWWQRVEKEKDSVTGNMAWWVGDELTDMYPANLNNALILDGPCSDLIDLSKAFAADVIFSTWFNISDGDFGYFEISTDDGDSWTIIGTYNGVSGDNSDPEWITEWFDLDDYLGEMISIRFRFTSDNNEENVGWFIDDIRIIAKIDENPPVSDISMDDPNGLNDWYTSSVQITLSATDDYSGVANIYYKIDGGSQSSYTSPVTVSDDGSHTFEFWAVDNVGNTETSKQVTFKIDKTDPSGLTISEPVDGLYLRGNKIWPIFNFSLFTWSPPIIIGQITIKVDVTDATSGINNVEFFIDDNSTASIVNEPFEWTWDQTAFFTHTIKVKAFDKAGNSVETTKDVRIFNINLLG